MDLGIMMEGSWLSRGWCDVPAFASLIYYCAKQKKKLHHQTGIPSSIFSRPCISLIMLCCVGAKVETTIKK